MDTTWTVQLRKGLVELTVLAALRSGEAYGYQVLQRLNPVAGLSLTESSVYPLLARLQRQRLVTVRVAPSPMGPPRRYYRLTAQGRSRLAKMQRHWRAVSAAVDRLLKGDLK